MNRGAAHFIFTTMLVCLAISSAFAQKMANPAKHRPGGGDSAFTLMNVAGKEVRSRSLTQKTPIIVVFVRKNCPAFAKASADLARLTIQTRGFIPIAFVFDSDAATAEKMLSNAKILGLALVDPGAKTIKALGGRRSLDMTVIGEDQKILKTVSGVDFNNLQAVLDAVSSVRGSSIHLNARRFSNGKYSGEAF